MAELKLKECNSKFVFNLNTSVKRDEIISLLWVDISYLIIPVRLQTPQNMCHMQPISFPFTYLYSISKSCSIPIIQSNVPRVNCQHAMSEYQSLPVPHRSPIHPPSVKPQIFGLESVQFLKCLVSQTSEGGWMSSLHMERPPSPEGRELVETGYETDSPELVSSSGFWGPSLLRRLLQVGSWWQVWRTQGFWLAAEISAVYKMTKF